jgi:glutathione synthase
MRALVIMDPIDKIDPQRDTTLALVEELYRRQHDVELVQAQDLEIERGEAIARVATVVEFDRAVFPCLALVGAQWRRLSDYDLILLGDGSLGDLSPSTCDLLFEPARRSGTLLLNDPRALANGGEQLATLLFPALTPPTRLTRSPARIEDFIACCGGHVVVRPLAGSVDDDEIEVSEDDPGRHVLLHQLTLGGERAVLVQAALRDEADEKHIVLLDGRPIGALIERRTDNLVGTRLRRAEPDGRDREICAAVAPALRARGVPLASLTVVGGWLTGIDTACNDDVQTLNRLHGVHLEQQIIDWAEDTLAEQQRRVWRPRRVGVG